MLAVLSPTKLTGDVKTLDGLLKCGELTVITNETKLNVKQNKVHDKQIIVAKLQQEKSKR